MTIVTGAVVAGKPTYTTDEAAKALGISKSTILRWLKQGRIDEVRRDRNEWRVFTQADIDAIRKRIG